MTALLALLLSWSPVVTDCLGFFEDHVTYEVSFVSWECWQLDTEEPVCAVDRIRRMQDETEAQFWPPAAPKPGAGYWYEIRSRDLAGNWSGECP